MRAEWPPGVSQGGAGRGRESIRDSNLRRSSRGCKADLQQDYQDPSLFLKVGLVDVPSCCDTSASQKQLEGHFLG